MAHHPLLAPGPARLAVALLSVLALTSACGADVGVAGTIPPAPLPRPTDPSGLSDTPTPVASDGLTTPALTPEASPDGSPHRTPRPILSPSPGAESPTALPTAAPSASAPPSGSEPSFTPTASPDTGTSPSPEPATPTSMGVSAYFLLDSGGGPTLVPVQRRIARAPGTGAATMRTLLAGPKRREAAEGISSAIPADVTLLGLTIEPSRTTVDLSGDFAAGASGAELVRRVAQVVYTLTQYSNVRHVLFEIDGQPFAVPTDTGGTTSATVEREDYLDQLPPIFVESPRFDQGIGAVLRISGEANVFEAVFEAELRSRDGTLLADKVVMASCGTGCWGQFTATLSFPPGHAGPADLTVFVRSAADGSIQDQRTYKVVIPAG